LGFELVLTRREQMPSLETSQDLRVLHEDLCQLAGVNPTLGQWLQEEGGGAASAELRTHQDVQQWVAGLLLRLIGMEISLS
jgi:hypothetical protein